MSSNMGFLDNASRIGEDECGLSQTNFQNAEVSNYMLKNFYLQDCGMKRPIEIATAQPNIFFNGGNGVGMGGCNVDESSQLLLGKVQTNPKCRISLIERPYLTVPYLGKGPSNSMLESQLQQGNTITNRKSVNNTSEESYMSLKTYPVIDAMERSAMDPAKNNKLVNSSYDVSAPRTKRPIEESSLGCVRGGMASRDLTRKMVN